MTLVAGTRLGPYEISAAIGAGGMGEVFRARDTKLDRDVAIKVLPSELAQDRERLARFEREAKLLAFLNHPNIAHVYGTRRPVRSPERWTRTLRSGFSDGTGDRERPFWPIDQSGVVR